MTPRRLRWASLGIALGAFAVSLYLAIAHLLDPELLVCAATSVINCTKVTTSAQSVTMGVPVAYLGVIWSSAMVGLCLPVAWRSRAPWVGVGRLVLAIAGVAYILWLIYAELFLIRAICLWCTVVHVLTFALFVVVVLAWIAPPEASSSREQR